MTSYCLYDKLVTVRGGVSVSVEAKVKDIVADQLEVAADKLSMETTFEDIDAD